ncbi:MAG: hypothetical protein AAF572_09695 [Cyanobacteria bacterium P01_B01_bin.77]
MKKFIATSSLVLISALGLPINVYASGIDTAKQSTHSKQESFSHQEHRSQQTSFSQQSSYLQENRTSNFQSIQAVEGVAVVIPQTIIFNADEGQELPLTLALAQPILDRRGNILAPSNSLLNAKIIPSNNGGQIVAETLMVNGQVISLRAYSSVIPSTTITVDDGRSRAENNANNLSRVGMALGCTVENFTNEECNSNSMRTGGSIGLVFGLMSNRREPETREVVQIPQDSLMILTTQ